MADSPRIRRPYANIGPPGKEEADPESETPKGSLVSKVSRAVIALKNLSGQK
jgi:hypothetical protein